MGAFTFSPEEGTVAADMDGQIDEEIKQARYDELMTLQHRISLEQNKARVGTTCRVLVEKKRGNRYVGRSEFEAPETDGVVFVSGVDENDIGTFVKVRITQAQTYDLLGVKV
jgi:ribosomal protein S12 methylthiotransferase